MISIGKVKQVKLKSVAALILGSMLFFMACTKEERLSDDQDPPVESYLAKYFWIKSNSGTLDTLMTVLFYDNQRRVTAVHDSLVNNGMNTFFAKIDYYYHGVDSFPFKSQLFEEDGQFRDSTTRYFFYDNSGRRSKDSIIERYTHTMSAFDEYLIIKDYQYSAGNIFGLASRTDLSNQITTTTVDTAVLNAQNNIIESVRYVGSVPQTRFTFNYDNHPTPFANTSIKVTRDVFPRGSTYHDLLMFNNVTYIKEENLQSGTTLESFLTYTYDSVGRPLNFSFPNPSNPNRSLKMEFVYSTW